MKPTTTDNIIFIYSEMQQNALDKVAKLSGKKFVCGRVYVGMTPKLYTQRIPRDKLAGLTSQYPDAKLIATGSDLKYDQPTKVLNRNNH